MNQIINEHGQLRGGTLWHKCIHLVVHDEELYHARQVMGGRGRAHVKVI